MKMVLALISVLLLVCPVFASQTDPLDGMTDFGASRLVDGLTQEQKQLMGDIDPVEGADLWSSLRSMLFSALRGSSGILRKAAGQSASLLAVCLLCSLFSGGTEDTQQAAVMAGVVAITIICLSPVDGMLRLSSDTVREVTAFSQLFLPVLASASAAAGAVTSGPAVCGAAVLLADVLLSLMDQFLIPGVSVFLALSAADAALNSASLRRFCSLASWAVKSGLKVLLYGFTGFLTVTQVVAGSADAMTAKAAKLTLSGMVPVVGSILSDASETLLVSASIIRNSIGVYGLLAVSAVCILPFLRIGIWYLCLKVTAAVAGITAKEPTVRMVEAVSEGMGMLLGMTGTAALMTVITVVCSLRLAGGA
ncbi:MAG: hypothetical protein IJP11_05270 [Oscillospiraceae bacterium]|nr:hypothetical protein [Oscillospiraceae bacterium]